jgi:tetratricopeptide (TPR) repeat protein
MPSNRPNPHAAIGSALLAAVLILAVAGCAPADPSHATGQGPEAISLLGQPLYPPALTPERRAELERELAGARADYERDPASADAILWVGRRLAYLGRYREAIEVFGDGIEKHPEDARMYRHRGHRWITLRRFDDAIRDLDHAARLVAGRPDQVEPDGMPNPYGIPTSTLHTNIWYHLALAHYLKHDFEQALVGWRRCLEAATNDDMRVATADWLYMTYRRLGRDAEAARVLEPFHADMEILENHAYHERLLMYKGEIPVEALLSPDAADPIQLATYGYGVANWHLYNGDRDQAMALFRRVVAGPAWAAFGHIAAEAELAAGSDTR